MRYFNLKGERVQEPTDSIISKKEIMGWAIDIQNCDPMKDELNMLVRLLEKIKPRPLYYKKIKNDFKRI